MDSLISSLTAIGFTEHEARMYLALLRENPATGYQLGKKTGVPRSMVYEALNRLHARGAVLRTEQQGATLYQPLPPDVLLERHEHEQRRLVQSLQGGLSAIYTANSQERFWSVSGRTSALAYAAQLIQRAARDLWLVLADRDLEQLREMIGQAAGRGVAISALLTGSGALEHGRVEHHPPLESDLQGLTSTLIVVVDDQEALIANGEGEVTATITNNRNFVLIARQFVWMELFAQRVYTRLGDDLLRRLDPADREIFTHSPAQPRAPGEHEGQP